MKKWQMRLVLLTVGASALAQPAMPTAGILSRILMIKSQYDRGTVFSLDVDGKEYWITAKHILTGAQHPPYGAVTESKMVLKILDPRGQGEHWIDREVSVIDTGLDIDEVVLAPTKAPVLSGTVVSSLEPTSKGVPLGGDCSFLGFPYGSGWRMEVDGGSSTLMPFVKRCGVSAMLGSPPTWVLDGINNVGFSGGPVLYGTGLDQHVFAVISGYRTEPAEIVNSGSPRLSPPPKQSARAAGSDNQPRNAHQTASVNSGFIMAYDIQYAISAIKAHPIGPSRTAQ